MFSHGNAEKNMLGTEEVQNKYYDETIQLDINNPNDSHALIAKQVKEKSTCLDIGCGPGYIGELLKKEKNCKIYGIEIDNEAINIARNRACYEEIFSFSITNTKSKEYKEFFTDPIKFDYIIFGDVLEHLEKPEKILIEFLKKLKKQGKLLISIPNIAHFDICKNLLNRTFNYNTKGILDQTHLRFFTKESFIEMIKNINTRYHIPITATVVGTTIAEPQSICKYPNLYKILNQDNESCAVQYIYEIVIDESQKEQEIKYVDYSEKLEKELQEKQIISKKLKETDEEIQILTRKFQDLQQQYQTATKQCEILQQETKKILESKSWKITKPLRYVSKCIKK